MKVIICVVAAFAALQFGDCYTPYTMEREGVNEISLNSLKESMRGQAAIEKLRGKINEVCPGYGYRLENVTMEIASCAATINESQETTCSLVNNHIKRCLNPLTSLFEECLPTQAKQLPAMILDMLIATSNHLCKTDGEHIFELGNSCIKTLNPKTRKCVTRLTTRIEQYQRKESVPSANDICEFMTSLRPCFQSHVTAACGHPITRETYLGLFDEALKVCKNYEKNEIEGVEIM